MSFPLRLSEGVFYTTEFRSGIKNDCLLRYPEGENNGAALSFVSFFVAVDKESDLPWVNHPLPPKHQIKNKGEKKGKSKNQTKNHQICQNHTYANRPLQTKNQPNPSPNGWRNRQTIPSIMP